MAKLNQIIAVETGTKPRVLSTVSELYKTIQHEQLFNGFVKTYTPNEEAGEKLPDEKKPVAHFVDDMLSKFERAQSELMEVTARKDWSNTQAKADVVVGEKVLVKDAPVTYLLFLEKRLEDVRTFIGALPVLDATESWVKEDKLYKTASVNQNRTKKVQKPIVLYPATPEHPAQTQIITEDINVGIYNTTKMSGAIRLTEKEGMLERVDTLIKAVKEARESANNQDEVAAPEVGVAVFDYILGS